MRDPEKYSWFDSTPRHEEDFGPLQIILILTVAIMVLGYVWLKQKHGG